MSLVERLAKKADYDCIGDCTEAEARWWLNAIADELEEAFRDTIAGEAHWLRSQAKEETRDD